MKFRLIIWITIIALFGIRSQLSAQSVGTVQPNILVITIDDLNDYVGAFAGHSQVRTPNLDRLARRGTIFTNTHCAAPVCAPSRAALFTGKHAEYTGIYNNGDYEVTRVFRDIFPPGKTIYTYPELLKDSAGYYTYSINKTFHGAYGPGMGENDKDFDEATSDPCMRGKSWSNLVDWRNICSSSAALNGSNCRNDGMPDLLYGEHISPLSRDQRSTDSAIAFLDAYIDNPSQFCDRPFLLNLGYWRPHYAWFAPEVYFPTYYEQEIGTLEERIFNFPANADPPNGFIMPPQPVSGWWTDTAEASPLGLRYISNTHKKFQFYADSLSSIPVFSLGLSMDERMDIVDENKRAQAIMAYVACVQWVDDMVGQVLDHLESYPSLFNNTVIILTSDHGYALGEKKDWAKPDFWETVTRVPLIIVDPRVEGSKRCIRPASLIDIFPTVLDFAGLDAPKLDSISTYPDGISLRPWLIQPDLPSDRAVMMSYFRPEASNCFPDYSLRTERFHYMRFQGGGGPSCDEGMKIIEEELYEIGANREVDPNEWNNLMNEPAYASMVPYLSQWLPDGPRYRGKSGFSAQIEALDFSCAIAPQDTLRLMRNLFGSEDSSSTATSAFYRTSWTIYPGGITHFGDSLSYIIPAADSTGKLLVHLQVEDTVTGLLAADIGQFYLASDMPQSLFTLDLIDNTVSVQGFSAFGPKADSVLWLYSDGWTSRDSIAPAHQLLHAGNYQVQHRSYYGNGCYTVSSDSVEITDSMLALLPCQAPYPIQIGNLDYHRLELNWNEVFGGLEYSARLRPLVPVQSAWLNTNWDSSLSVSTDRIGQNTAYEIQVKARCDTTLRTTEFSDWTYPMQITTPWCPPPLNLRAEATSSSTAVLHWDKPAKASLIDVLLKEKSPSGGELRFGNLSTDSLVMVGLPSGANFRIVVRSVCYHNDSSYYRSNEGKKTTFSTPDLRSFEAQQSHLTVHPNPAASKVFFGWKDQTLNAKTKEGIMQIYNTVGLEQWSGSWDTQTELLIPIIDWPAGVYLYRFIGQSADGSTTSHNKGSFVVMRDHGY